MLGAIDTIRRQCHPRITSTRRVSSTRFRATMPARKD